MQNQTNSLRRVFLSLFLIFGIVLGMAAPSAFAAKGKQLTGVVNINTATSEELQLLPGVGESRAKLILEERTRRGGFKHVEDLLVIKGIGEKGLTKLKPYLALEGKTTAKQE